MTIMVIDSKRKKRKQLFTVAFSLLVSLIVISCSLTIDSVVMPSGVNAGDNLDVTLNCTLITNQSQTSKFMVAVLVPKVWNAAKNTTVTFTSSISTGAQGMAVIAAGTPAPNGNGLDWPTYLAGKLGNGGNLQNEWEWVAFYSNLDYSVGGNVTIPIKVNIHTKVSSDNLLCKLGYAVANSTDGLSSSDRYGAYFSSCFRVTGQGDLLDFCNPQLSVVDPRTSLDNDIVTVSFDASLVNNALANAPAVYLCATGITTDGTRINRCAQTTATQMTSLGLNRWQKDFWPRSFFGLTSQQKLAGMEYYFTDAGGTVKIGYGGGSDPFTYTFKCP